MLAMVDCQDRRDKLISVPRQSSAEDREDQDFALRIGPQLKAARRERHLSLEAVAERVGISKQNVWEWERGTFVPGARKLVKLAELYGVSVDRLLGTPKSPVGETEGDLVLAFRQALDATRQGILLVLGLDPERYVQKAEQPQAAEKRRGYPVDRGPR